MKKMKFLAIATLTIVFAFALYGCGGNQQKEEPAGSAPAEASAPVEASAAPEAPAAEAPAAVEAGEVNPELVAAGDELKGLVSQYVEQVNQAVESGDVEPFRDAIDEIQGKINPLVDKITAMVPTDDPSDPNMVYYQEEIAPIVLRDYADAAFEYADMLMAGLEK